MGAVAIMKICGNHIFIRKIFNHWIFNNFTKILNHKNNLGLYGTYLSSIGIALHDIMHTLRGVRGPVLKLVSTPPS